MARTRSRAPEMLISPLWEYNKDEIAGYSRVAPNIEQWSFISRPPPRRSLSPSSSTPSSLLSQRLKRSARRTFALMIKRMASKLHLGHSKNVPADSASSSSAASSYTASSAQSVSTLSLSHEHRASISTERTSLHEWVKSQSEAMQQDRSEIEVRRSKGSYRLSDFIIQRTLGTGSFGRVHLGECCCISCQVFALAMPSIRPCAGVERATYRRALSCPFSPRASSVEMLLSLLLLLLL